MVTGSPGVRIQRSPCILYLVGMVPLEVCGAHSGAGQLRSLGFPPTDSTPSQPLLMHRGRPAGEDEKARSCIYCWAVWSRAQSTASPEEMGALWLSPRPSWRKGARSQVEANPAALHTNLW